MERFNLIDFEPTVSGIEVSLTTQDEHRADKAKMYRAQRPMGQRGLNEVVIQLIQENEPLSNEQERSEQ